MLLAFLSMAKKRGRRRGRYVLVAQGDAEIAGSTLAAVTALTGAMQAVADRPIFLISVDAAWTWKDITLGDGPLTVGYAHSDYTVTEIKEYIEGNTGFTRASMTEREIQTRKIRIAGVLNPDAGGGVDASLRGGDIVRTKLGFSIPAGETLNAFIYNKGTALTTGSEVQLTFKVYFRPS